MAPYRGKHRRTSADEEPQRSEVADERTPTASEDAAAEALAIPPSAPAGR